MDIISELELDSNRRYISNSELLKFLESQGFKNKQSNNSFIYALKKNNILISSSVKGSKNQKYYIKDIQKCLEYFKLFKKYKVHFDTAKKMMKYGEIKYSSGYLDFKDKVLSLIEDKELKEKIQKL